MAKGVPSREELEKAMIINTFTTILGVVIGIAISQWWKNHQAKNGQLSVPSASAFGDL